MEIVINKTKLKILTLLRVLIGWHFLYEGMVKVVDPDWSSFSFLNAATGPLSKIFKLLSSNELIVQFIDVLNVWGLILIGLSLILGLMSRYATIAGMVLLILYYLVNPPFIGSANSPAEGHYLIVNMNLIEFVALWVLYLFPTQNEYGLDRLILLNKA
ncbi:MAG: DoxX family membrane protein [Candidatus Cyclobacteriaceae bacterium M3_2C_046]